MIDSLFIVEYYKAFPIYFINNNYHIGYLNDTNKLKYWKSDINTLNECHAIIDTAIKKLKELT
jgi:uncharacterized protein YqkB